MMRAGAAFTYQGRRYEAGDRVDLGAVPAHLHGTLTRLYGLVPARKRSTEKESEL